MKRRCKRKRIYRRKCELGNGTGDDHKLKNEIRNQYNQAYSLKETVTSTKLILDHFESANIVTDASGDTITDKEDLKKILDGDIVNLEEKYGQITKI